MEKLGYRNIKKIKKNNEELVFEHLNDKYENDNKLACCADGRTLCLKSNMDMELPIQIWCEQFDDVRYNTIFAIFGMGYVEYLLQLSKLFSDNLILVYEPDERNIVKQLETSEMAELVVRNNIIWITGKTRRAILCKTIDERMDYKNGVDIKLASVPNYIKMYREEWNFFNEQIGVAKMYMEVSRNTRVVFEKDRGKCFLFNIFDMINQSSVQNLVNQFAPIDVCDCPAVIIAAGPSLDKNIQDLKMYQDQVFIICLDSAIRTALKWEITPDLLICVDPNKNPELFNNELGKKIPLVTHLYCNYKVTQMSEGRKFYTSDQEEYETMVLGKYKKKLGILSTGGTVANTAFSLLQSMGFQTIILIGQDLAYPEKRIHTKEANSEKEIDEGLDGKYFYVEGIDGKPVLSEYNMSLYRKWYEEQIFKFPEMKVIDATEGGALIKGTIIMTLKEALANNCTGKKKNFSALIQKADDFLSKDEQSDLKKCIYETILEIPQLVVRLKEQLVVYDRLDILNRKGKYGTNEFRKCIENISNFNRIMDENKTILLMQLFANQGECIVQDKLQKRCNSNYQEIAMMVEVGKQLIETYIDAGGKLLDAWQEIKGNVGDKEVTNEE